MKSFSSDVRNDQSAQSWVCENLWIQDGIEFVAVVRVGASYYRTMLLFPACMGQASVLSVSAVEMLP